MKNLSLQFSIFFVSFIAVLFSLFFVSVSPSIVYAETHITDETVFQGDTVWNKDGSPYILDDSISIPPGQSLSVDPGVTITASSTTDNPISIFVEGDMTVAGTASEPVTIDGLDSMTFSRSNVSLYHADISLPNGIDIFYGTTTVASSTIHGSRDPSTNASKAISLWGSTLDVEDSSLYNNDYGIYSYDVSSGPFLSMFSKIIFGQPALADSTDDPRQNHISIVGSDIINNAAYGIYNATQNIIHAENNWWGNTVGPGTTTLYGPVDDIPWLAKDPMIPSPAEVAICCSNVLFLPGIEASRLYSSQRGDKLWEPLHDADVQNLFLTDAGVSIDPSVYANGIIDSAYGFGIYNNFITMMNTLVHDGTINAWEPFAYDWRFGVDSFVKGINAATSTAKLISDFQTLASSSKTGKVTIVAHSDGGLLATMLEKTLADTGRSGLIDKMVMVAVPELGTPQAIAGLLHGDNQDILDGFILGKDTARELGDNAPGAYGLLPSKDYFKAIPGALLPIISFATSTLGDFHFAGDGTMTGNNQTISTYDSLRTFLAGIADHRRSPADDEVTLPTVLHASMLDEAENVHNILDAASLVQAAPSSISSFPTVVSLIGVGADTLTALRYSEKANCPLTNTFIGIYHQQPCTDSLVHTASTTLFGDGTVVDVSAEGIPGTLVGDAQKYYFNLFADNEGKIIPDSHATLLNSNSGTAFAKEIILASSSSSLSLPPYVTDTEPTLADFDEDNLVIIMHSPVDVNIYDSQGRHTGPIPNPDLTSDIGRYEENIPDSVYDPEATNGTMVTVPYGTDYKVILNGTGSGSFTLDTERDKNGAPVAGTETEFVDMPATPLLKAELVLATTTGQLLTMDFDGDGIIDATSTSTSTPGGTMDPTSYLRSMERTIRSFNLSTYRDKVMCDKIDKIISYIVAKKPIKLNEETAITANHALSDIRNQHWIFKNLDQTKKDRLTAMFQSILDSVDI